MLDLCETAEDFAEYDRLEAQALAGDAEQAKWTASTLGEVAELFGMAVQTVKQWRMESPPMPGGDGCYPLKDIIQWRMAKVSQSDLAAAKRQQDYELGQIQVEAKRLELDREKGLILDRSEVELWASTALVELREGVMQLPEMLAASAPEELKGFVREETDRHCRDLLTATARRLEMSEIGEGSTPDDQA